MEEGKEITKDRAGRRRRRKRRKKKKAEPRGEKNKRRMDGNQLHLIP